jgi:threonine/homoserine/homoserine lactone efflux protein
MTSDRSLTRRLEPYTATGLRAVAAICLAWAGYQSLRDEAAPDRKVDWRAVTVL